MQPGHARWRVVLAPLLIAAIGRPWTTSMAAGPDDFIVVNAVTVRFGDGKFEVSRSQRSQLQQLASQAQGLPDYLISIAASAPEFGPDPNNQKLSMQRASVITTILRMAGVPIANVIVSPATHVNQPQGANATSRSDKQDAVVTLLRNKSQ